MKPEILYSVKAQRGPALRCKGWKQESLLRMLENNMENAEAPERLVIYGGIGKCARNWESYHAIVDSLLNLENDETLAIQSGMPVAIFKTHRLAPRVVMANTNIMKATWPIFYDLQDKNLTMFAQYTAGPWEYIGTQGVIQGTFETLAPSGTSNSAGRWPAAFSSPPGWAAWAQPAPCHDHARRRVSGGGRQRGHHRQADPKKFLDVKADTLEEGIELAEKAKAEGRPWASACTATRRRCSPGRWHWGRPDIVTEMCPCHDPFSYIAAGHRWRRRRATD